MTTKKFKEEFRKKIKSIDNLIIEAMFSDYFLYKNGKRIGVISDTGNLKKQPLWKLKIPILQS